MKSSINFARIFDKSFRTWLKKKKKKKELPKLVKFLTIHPVYCRNVLHGSTVISRDDSRVESYSFDSLPTERASSFAIVFAEMQNVFVSLRSESRYIFFKASPAHRIGVVRDGEEGAVVGEP